ncbi:hypothetical protein, partial [Alicyclobacillus sp.]|uniref:hypothetical protein n=1 Tax=Alicyclobacillus sp. TaxID=61169 RepID=UPI0025C1E875
FAPVLQHLEQSIHAEQVFCSIVTEMKFMPAFKDDPNLAEVHRQNYETSYHRNTAAGNLRRLLAGAGPSEEMLVLMTIECFVEAKRHDRQAEEALKAIRTESPADEGWIQAAERWHARRRQALRMARRLLRQSVSEETWAKGVALAE